MVRGAVGLFASACNVLFAWVCCLLLVGGLFDMYDLLRLLVNLCLLGFATCC